MSTGEGVALAVGINLLAMALLEFTRPKGARVFSRGTNGEDELMFNPASAKKKSG